MIKEAGRGRAIRTHTSTRRPVEDYNGKCDSGICPSRRGRTTRSAVPRSGSVPIGRGEIDAALDEGHMKQILAMLGGTADGAFLVDENGKIVFWNKAAERMLGFAAEEVIGRPCHDVFRGETLGGHLLCSPSCPIGSRLVRGRAVRNFDMQTRTKRGRLIWLNVSSLPVPSRKKGRFLAAHLFRDITKQAKVRRLADKLHVALCVPERAAAHESATARTIRPPHEATAEIPPSLPLSERERDVLRLLAGGEDTKRIADHLCISPATVRNHIQHILEKLGAHTRLQALAIAFHPGDAFAQ